MTDQLATVWVLEGASLRRGDELSQFIARLIEAAASSGEMPNRSLIEGMHGGVSYRAFVKKRLPQYLQAIRDARYATILHVAQFDLPWEQASSWYVAFDRDADRFSRDADQISCHHGRIDIGVMHSSALYSEWRERLFVEELSQSFGGTYGYRFVQETWRIPKSYAEAYSYGDRHKDLSVQEVRLSSTWSARGAEARACGVLRDVYPSSWLSANALDRGVGLSGPSLRNWILSDSSRGELEERPTGLTAWHAPAASIPLLREELYRGGRILDWRFSQKDENWRGHPLDHHPPNPLYRPDLCIPWEAPGQIPEFFRADFYEDRDPGLTL